MLNRLMQDQYFIIHTLSTSFYILWRVFSLKKKELPLLVFVVYSEENS